MGIDMVLNLVVREGLRELLQMQVSDLISALESNSLPRVAADSRLERPFDIDVSAELLDWFDDNEVDKDTSLHSSLQGIPLSDACDCLLLCAQWASLGHWEVWEGRSFIYLETLIQRNVDDVNELYSSQVWQDASSAVLKLNENEYSESVILDWMRRREELEATLDENADPHILPTMDAHQRSSRLLHHALVTAQQEGAFLLLGREHMNADKWGLDEFNLAHILAHGL